MQCVTHTRAKGDRHASPGELLRPLRGPHGVGHLPCSAVRAPEREDLVDHVRDVSRLHIVYQGYVVGARLLQLRHSAHRAVRPEGDHGPVRGPDEGTVGQNIADPEHANGWNAGSDGQMSWS